MTESSGISHNDDYDDHEHDELQLSSSSSTNDDDKIGKNSVVVIGEAPESDDDDYVETAYEMKDDMTRECEKTEKVSNFSFESFSSNETIRFNSLLHNKLRETNEHLRRELLELAFYPYNSSAKELTNVTKQLVQSQRTVQSVSACLRKINKELSLINDKIEDIKCNNSLLLIDFVNKKENDL